jgi:hypothetical protein
MSDFDYKKYSLEHLENWMHDALSSAEASPHEIYSTIRNVVQEQYIYHKENAQKCFGLLELLSGHRPVNLDEDKVVQWILSTEVDGLTGDVFVTIPDDLLEAANLKEGDRIEWVDQGDGSFLLKKVDD